MRKSILVSLVILALVLAAGSVSAFVLFDPPQKWAQNSLPRTILVSTTGHSNVNDPDGGVTRVIEAIDAAWNNAGVGGLITLTPTANPPYAIGDGTSSMGFNVSGTGCTGGCLGITIAPIAPASPIEPRNGVDFRIQTDSDIFFNPSSKFYSDDEADGCRREYHIESVGVHEAGHFFGLDHTPITSATMYAFTNQCDEQGVTLHQDDLDGISCIYGNGSCGGCVADTLIVDQTNCSQPSSGPNAGDFVVETFIVDNCGSPVDAADVTIDIPTSPNGPLSCSGQTASNGRLGCALSNPPDGLYESLVTSVAKSGSSWPGTECGGVGQAPCGCDITIGGGGGNDCGNGTCDAGESCDGRNGTVSCPADCPGQTKGNPSGRFCYVGGVCEGPGCP